MKTAVRKAKGRRCAQDAKKLMLDTFPEVHPDDIQITPSGVTGPDMTFFGGSRRVLPFVVECKNKQTLNIWQALDQSKNHYNRAKDSERVPVVIFKRNHTGPKIAMELGDFLKIWAWALKQKPPET